MTDKMLAEWFWVDRWTGSSAFLLAIEPRGLYREMMSQAWRRKCRLPNDPEAIRRAVACTVEEWDRCWPVIRHYWRAEGDALVNDTQLEVYKIALAGKEASIERARKGGKAAAKNRRARARAQASGLQAVK